MGAWDGDAIVRDPVKSVVGGRRQGKGLGRYGIAPRLRGDSAAGVAAAGDIDAKKRA